jgi:hypothetical protein
MTSYLKNLLIIAVTVLIALTGMFLTAGPVVPVTAQVSAMSQGERFLISQKFERELQTCLLTQGRSGSYSSHDEDLESTFMLFASACRPAWKVWCWDHPEWPETGRDSCMIRAAFMAQDALRQVGK